MSKLQTLRRKPKGAKKGKAKLFEFERGLDEYLVKQAAKEGKTMVQFVEELLAFRKQFKTLPKEAA